MRDFALFLATFIVWAVTGMLIALLAVACAAAVYWTAETQLAPYLGPDRAQWLATLAGIVSGIFSAMGVSAGLSTLAAEPRQSGGNATNRDRAPRNPPTGGTSGQRSSSSPPLPGSTRPDPRKEHNP